MATHINCWKFAILGVVALAAPPNQLKLLIGVALPLPEIIEMGFAYLQGREGKEKKKKLKDLSLTLAKDVETIVKNDKNAQAVIELAERCIGHFGLTETEFTDLRLDARAAAKTVFSRLKGNDVSSRTATGADPTEYRFSAERDLDEIEGQTLRVLEHFYHSVAEHPAFTQDLLPHIFRSLDKSDEERAEAIKEEIRAHFRAARMPDKPKFDVGIPNLREEFYEVRCPATPQEYDTVAGWAEATFEPGETIDAKADKEAFKRNPYSMVVLANYLGDIVGFVDIYHLPDAILDAVLADKTGDVVINPADCLDYEQASACTRAYVATLMVRPEPGISTGRRVLALIYGMMEFILKHQFHGTDHFELWSIGARPEGSRTLKVLKFEQDGEVATEPGGQLVPAFRRRFSKEELVREQTEFFSEHGLRNVVLNVHEHG